jgi:hypothetical protein
MSRRLKKFRNNLQKLRNSFEFDFDVVFTSKQNTRRKSKIGKQFHFFRFVANNLELKIKNTLL